jgi:hypothetical protein
LFPGGAADAPTDVDGGEQDRARARGEAAKRWFPKVDIAYHAARQTVHYRNNKRYDNSNNWMMFKFFTRICGLIFVCSLLFSIATSVVSSTNARRLYEISLNATYVAITRCDHHWNYFVDLCSYTRNQMTLNLNMYPTTIGNEGARNEAAPEIRAIG